MKSAMQRSALPDSRSLKKSRSRATKARVLEMRISGASSSTIAQALGISVPAVSYHLRSELEFLSVESANLARELKGLDLARLDLLLAHWLPRATQRGVADKDAALIVLKILERRARYLALDDQPGTLLNFEDNRTLVVTPESLQQMAAEAMKVIEHKE